MSYHNPSSFDSLLLQSLLGRLQLGPTHLNPNPLSQSLEDLLLNSDFEDDDDDGDEEIEEGKKLLTKEESKLEKEIIRIIHSGNTDSLKPNSGQAVAIFDHYICISFHEERNSDYRVWEWHGHIMIFNEENGYSPEYIYGNYFERIQYKAPKKEESEDGEKVDNLGLRELIGSNDSNNGRILCRNSITSQKTFTK